MGKGDTATDTLMDGPITWGTGDIVSLSRGVWGDAVTLAYRVK